MIKSCPTCGYRGDAEHCPNDGAVMRSEAEMAAEAVEDPTLAPPVDMTGRQHATAAGKVEATDDAHLRGEDYGNWAEPEMPSKPKKDPLIGRTIQGRYEVIGLLGKGGMGAVYKARQPAVQRTIALKVLLQEFADNETVMRRFHQEALAASRLEHPNTISVYDFGQTDDKILYIAMELLRGDSLAQALKKVDGMTPRRVVHIMLQVCKSLSEAHNAGIIHRDLKPDNIFLTDIRGEQDYVKVLDFGVAKLKELEGHDGTLTQAGMIFGTPKYMSPEQARSGELDARSDIYALGIILYEMLLGRPPFTSDNPLSILISHVNENPEPFEQRRPDKSIPKALEAVVFKAMAKDREQRHASVDELYDELEAISALLAGTPYEQVADRLPKTAAMASVAVPTAAGAIVPGSTDGTIVPGGGGSTVALDGSKTVVESTPLGLGEMVLDEARPDADRGGNRAGMVVGALGLLVTAGAVFWVMQPSEAPKASQQPAVAAADAGPKAPPDAALAVAPKPDAAVAADAAAPLREFLVSSDPRGARIINVDTGEQVGVTYDRVAVRAVTKFRLDKSGYDPLEFELDPTDEERKKLFKLRAKPEPPKPSVRPKVVKVDKPKTVVVKPDPQPVVAQPPKQPEDVPIDLQ